MFYHQDLFVESVIDPEKVLIPKQLLQGVEYVWRVEKEAFCQKDWLDQIMRDPAAHVILNPIDPFSIDGFFQLNGKMAVLSEKLFGSLKGYSFKNKTLDLNPSKDDDLLKKRLYFDGERTKLINQARESFLEARAFLNIASNNYEDSSDDHRFAQLSTDLCDDVFSCSENEIKNHKKNQHCFYGNLSRSNAMDPNLVKNINRKIILKGRHRKGISKLLHVLESRANELDVSSTAYRCPFYTDDIDLIFFPNLNVAVIDGMAPHIFEPVHPGDRVYHVDEKCIDRVALLARTREIKEADEGFRQSMKKGLLELQQAKRYQKLSVDLSSPINDKLLKVLK